MNAKTAICRFDAEHIHVRGHELVDELVGRVNFIEMFLLQALGRKPGRAEAGIVDAVMVTIMEHGLVPSAVVTRLTHHGAPESFQGAVAAGLLGVGDRYAGTAGACGALLQRIVDSADAGAAAVAEVEALRAARSPIPGFGHPIHKQVDRRVGKLLELTRAAGTPGRHLAALDALVAAVDSVVNKGLVVNVSAAIAAALGEAGVPHPMMRGVVLTARCAGLVGHLLEEMQQPVADALWHGARSGVDDAP